MPIPTKSPFNEGDLIFKENKVCFSCFKDCSNICCTGATLLTAKEIANLYNLFAITIIFNKISPQSEEHALLLDMIGIKRGNQYIVGDFVAGNWRNKSCKLLNQNRECRLHLEGLKPTQCLIVPFSAIYPESLQGLVIVEQKSSKFSRCQGFKDTHQIIWDNGKFVEKHYSSAYYDYQRQLMKQREFMDKLLGLLKMSDSYREFVSKKGVLHSPITREVFDDFLILTNIQKDKIIDYLKNQLRLLKQEISNEGKGSIFFDSYKEILEIYRRYSK